MRPIVALVIVMSTLIVVALGFVVYGMARTAEQL